MSETGIRQVLLVEDDMVSRMLVEHMLKKLGWGVLSASDGREALQRLGIDADRLEGVSDVPGAYGETAVVLIDLNLPDMDGYEACALLRSIESGWIGRGLLRRRKPVIGMSANRRESGWERCREAGMDDLLEKPLDKQVAASALERWLDGADDGEEGGGACSAQAVAGSGEMAVLNVRWLLEAVEHDEALLGSVLGDFRTDTQVVFDALGEAVRLGDTGQVAEYAHRLAGAASYVGAEQLCQRCKDLEREARAGEGAGAGAAFEGVCEAYGQAREAVDRDAAGLLWEVRS